MEKTPKSNWELSIHNGNAIKLQRLLKKGMPKKRHNLRI